MKDAGHRAWLVGGCVRDELLREAGDARGSHRGDWDIATSAPPEQVSKLFRRVIPTGIQHGTVTVLMREGQYEVTTLRGETTYSDGRRPDAVYFVDDIKDDLARRDFTINAIAWVPTDLAGGKGTVHDPFGGRADLDARLLRTVGDPRARFEEDALRLIRAARFAGRFGMAIDPAMACRSGPSEKTAWCQDWKSVATT